MTKQEVETGKVYWMNHSSGRIKVRILGEKPTLSFGHRNGGRRTMTHWRALNLKTGREIEVKSAAKLLREVGAGE